MTAADRDAAFREAQAEGKSPPLVCAFALHRGRYCIRRYGHTGEHLAPRPAALRPEGGTQ